MKYSIPCLLFIAFGIGISLAHFSFLGRPPVDLTWGRIVFLAFPTAFTILIFHGLATGSMMARLMNVSKERQPIIFYFAAIFYLAISGFIYYVSRYVPGF